MRALIWILAIFILLLLQTALLPFSISPVNLLLVLVVVSLLFAGFDFGLVLAAGCGVALDCLSGSTDGTMALTFVTVFLCLYFAINFILAREPNLIILFFSVAAGTLGYFIFLAGFNELFRLVHLGIAVDYGGFFLIDLPKSLLFNLLFAYPVLRYYTWVESLTKKIRS